MKKKFYYAGMLAAGLLTFASCNNDEDPIIEQNPVQTEEDAQVIRIAVANAGDGLTTKAGRPLSSSDAAQDIDKVKIVIVDGSNNVIGAKLIENWMEVSSLYTEDGHGQEYTWKLSKEDALATGTYRVYAIGYSDNTSYDAAISTFAGLKSPGTLDNGYVATALSTAAAGIAEEIFAGQIDEITVNADGEFALEGNAEANVLTLHRQVTGTLGYFVNIPLFPVNQKANMLKCDPAEYKTYVEGLSLRLVVSNSFDKLHLSGFNSSFTETNEDVWYVVNGDKLNTKDGTVAFNYDEDEANPAAFGYTVYNIPLNEWFLGADVNMDGYLGAADAEGDNWVTPVGVDDAVDYQRGTVFAGEFLIPFTKVPNVNTMELQLVATKGLTLADGGNGSPVNIVDLNSASEKVVRTWKINLPEGDPQLSSERQGKHINILKNGIPVEWEANGAEELTNSYSLVRNHLYTVGSISEDDNEPEDLSKGARLMLRVNDNWEMIHKMEVE